MSDNKMRDIVEALSMEDGNYNEELNAYVTVYPLTPTKLAVEIEYVDIDNDLQVVDKATFTVQITED